MELVICNEPFDWKNKKQSPFNKKIVSFIQLLFE